MLAAGLVAAGALLATQGGSDAVTSPWPGLPDAPDATGWLGTAQTGITEATRAKQWAQVPLTMIASAYNFETQAGGTGPDGELLNLFHTYLFNWFVSPHGSTENYGEAPPITVRTVAFGSIPVQATLAISQRRDDEGAPIPLDTTTVTWRYADTHQVVDPVTLKDSLNVSVTDIKVDGIDLGLAGAQGGCHTTRPAPFSISSQPLTTPPDTDIDDPRYFDPTKNFIGQDGGTLAGTIDIPAFTNCRTQAGDDISPLLTATVSGPGNPLTARLGATGCFTTVKGVTLPPGPGMDTPAKANCQANSSPAPPSVPDELPYPARHGG